MNSEHMKSLAVPEINSDCQARIESLTSDTAPLWGKMSAAQMMAHCAEVLEVAGGREIQGTPWFIKLLKPLVRKMVLGTKSFPRNTRTHPQYLQVNEKDFTGEKARLIGSMKAFGEACSGKEMLSHPFFGDMTVDEAGWAMYKHLDHHLGQFGV